MKEELNLNNPIFVFYINIASLSNKAHSYIEEVRNSFDIYSNITQWIISTETSPTRIDCIYDGKSTNNKLVSLIKDINDRIEILSGSNSFEDFKINIRDWRLKGISTNKELRNSIKDINDRIEILSGSNSFEDFKINIRD
jgi:hypothetical protein